MYFVSLAHQFRSICIIEYFYCTPVQAKVISYSSCNINNIAISENLACDWCKNAYYRWRNIIRCIHMRATTTPIIGRCSTF